MGPSRTVTTAFIICAMRFLVLILLMLTLPLRSGMGDAMAASNAHHGTTHQQEAGLMASAAHGLEDCAGHGAGHSSAHSSAQPSGLSSAHLSHAVEQASEPVQASTAASDALLADAACDACSACQSCHAVGLAFSPADVASLPAPNAQPEALSIAFASAPDARDQKPPIS